MHGIILAGGSGSRLWPITSIVSKQLLPVYDKPMIFYPLALAMASGIRDFSVITTPRDVNLFQNLLMDGSQWGINVSMIVQDAPRGIPEAFKLVCDSKLKHGSLLILGDNLFYGSQMAQKVATLMNLSGAAIFGYEVNDVSPYGSFILDAEQEIVELNEKVGSGRGYAIPGLYKFDESVKDRTLQLKPSQRGELEIVDLLNSYMNDGILYYEILDRGIAWLDTGTVENFNHANELVRVIQSRQSMLIGSPHEVAFRKGWISSTDLEQQLNDHQDSTYASSLKFLLSQND